MARARSLTPDEHKRIAEAVRMAETRTAGEIYCVVARSSGSYFHAAALHVVVGIALASLGLAWLMHHWWLDPTIIHFVGAQVAAVAVALLLLWFFPALRLGFVTRAYRYRTAHDNALKQFLARNVHITTQRTGVLIFVSLAERYAAVIADAGISAHVGQDVWNGIVGNLTQNARKGRLVDGFLQAVGAVGTILAEHVPVTAHDRNELDDHVVEI